ncbi:MAG: hypothetical protein ACD_3C00086G0034 [uncultured bacterium (gcode 4)]|uniref:DUF2779 domain-containing protein n=1 Tax=uncultured bacterium (gcode 4) TaxID=1234023 RepID=K2GXP5_9BACT|nr:MAG: hypothetical protein ACD_3C00086G0034 [uncultured bacterium (gcode 4)]
MPNLITKSLYVDYHESNKLAWWKINNLQTYKFIKWIEDEEEWEDLNVKLGQKVEDVVGEYLFRKFWTKRTNVFEEVKFSENVDEEQEDIILTTYKNGIDSNIKRTEEAIKQRVPIIYQAWFIYNGLFCRVDYLVLNSNWNYDLIEVKAKTWVRKDRTYKKVPNKWAWNLEDVYLADISFQKYVITKVFEEKGLWILENKYFAYLNNKYVRDWVLEIEKLIVLDRVDCINEILLIWEDDDKKENRDDSLQHFTWIEELVKTLEIDINLSEEEFNSKYPFSWSKYLTYFWKDKPFWTIYWKWLTHNCVWALHQLWKVNLEDLCDEEVCMFNKADWTVWTARKFVDNYLLCKTNRTCIIEKWDIKWELNNLNYPLCFYDYETVSVPIPFLDKTSPYQQVVVQYSLHKVYENWDIKHYSWILAGTWEQKIELLEIKDNKNKVDFENEKLIYWDYKDVLMALKDDIWEDIDRSSFIVWHKPFENTRNKEVAQIFPELGDFYLKMNDNTYDLKEIFSKWLYFSLDFKGSCSIKYVLPALVPELSYVWMNVPNWLVAMNELNRIIIWEVKDDNEKLQKLTDLLLYCWQDSLAMFKIYEKVLSVLK